MKILLATDGQKQSEASLDLLMRFSLGPDDSLHVITVIDMAVPMSIDITGGSIADTEGFESLARQHAASNLESARQSLSAFIEKSGVSFSTDVLFGSPASRIVETARELNVDLIIMGSHGHNRLERLLLGSVSDSVVHHAACSVMVVRTD